jgi:uracil phosphoribosyltransferase
MFYYLTGSLHKVYKKQLLQTSISGFRRYVDDICALLGYLISFSDPLPLKISPIPSPGKSVKNYHTTPRNIPAERIIKFS